MGLQVRPEEPELAGAIGVQEQHLGGVAEVVEPVFGRGQAVHGGKRIRRQQVVDEGAHGVVPACGIGVPEILIVDPASAPPDLAEVAALVIQRFELIAFNNLLCGGHRVLRCPPICYGATPQVGLLRKGQSFAGCLSWRDSSSIGHKWKL